MQLQAADGKQHGTKKWTKQGMAISWPGHIDDDGGTRWQFHHVIDVVPTIPEATGIPAPEVVDGLEQKPIEGVSMAYTFKKQNSNAPSTHKPQYFEVAGDHAIYHDGWIASSKVVQAPWDNSGAAQSDPAGYPWKLYDLTNDWTQYEDVAARYPDKLKEMDALFWSDAEKYQVLPLDASKFTRLVQPRSLNFACCVEFANRILTVQYHPTAWPKLGECAISQSMKIYHGTNRMLAGLFVGLGLPGSLRVRTRV